MLFASKDFGEVEHWLKIDAPPTPDFGEVAQVFGFTFRYETHDNALKKWVWRAFCLHF